MAAVEASTALPTSQLDKLKAAAVIASAALKAVIAKAVDGASVVELCKLGDSTIVAEADKVYNKKGADKTAKGIAHPTTVSINQHICGFAPLESDAVNGPTKLVKGDVVKLVAGAHIDGYAVLSGETIVVGASASEPVTGLKADLLAAAHNCAEAALRSARAGERNSEVTRGVDAVIKEYEGKIKGVYGFVSHAHEHNELAGKKTIRVFASPEQRRDSDNVSILEEGDVYALDVVVTTGSAQEYKSAEAPTTIFGRVNNHKYDLKLKTSRGVFAEIQKKANAFPFHMRILDDENKAKYGVKDCAAHGLLRSFDVLQAPSPTDLTAQVHLTFAVTKSGAVRLSSTPSFYSSELVKPDTEIKSDEAKAVLSRPLKPARVKPAKPAAAAAANGTPAK